MLYALLYSSVRALVFTFYSLFYGYISFFNGIFFVTISFICQIFCLLGAMTKFQRKYYRIPNDVRTIYREKRHDFQCLHQFCCQRSVFSFEVINPTISVSQRQNSNGKCAHIFLSTHTTSLKK